MSSYLLFVDFIQFYSILFCLIIYLFIFRSVGTVFCDADAGSDVLLAPVCACVIVSRFLRRLYGFINRDTPCLRTIREERYFREFWLLVHFVTETKNQKTHIHTYTRTHTHTHTHSHTYTHTNYIRHQSWRLWLNYLR